MYSRRLIGSGSSKQIRQRGNHILRELDVILVEFATFHTKINHGAQATLRIIRRHVIPFAGIHRHRILQWTKIASPFITVRGRPEIRCACIMHPRQGRAK